VVGSASSGRKLNNPLWTVFKRFDNEVGRAVMDHRSSDVRFIDFDELGVGMPEESILGHGSQMLHIWSWQVMLAGLFPRGPGTGLSRAAFSGLMCSAVNANMALCPTYNDRCTRYNGCVLWMCMNSVRCDFVPTSTANNETMINATTNRPRGLLLAGHKKMTTATTTATTP